MEGKYAIAKYPKVLEVDEFINESTYILETNFELYNQADELEYSALNDIPFNIVEGLIINKSESKDGLVFNSDNNTLIKVYPTVTKVIIPNNITSIGKRAFYSCTDLTSVIIPTSVTTIGNYAFYYCSALTSITIPESVTTIGESAFQHCKNLTSVTFGENSKLKSISPFMFCNCRNLTNIEIPNNINIIDFRAFLDCDRLISVSISSSVKNIGEEAFYKCSNLTNVYYDGTPEQWNSIKIGIHNSNLINAKIHYNNLKEQFSKENKMQFKILNENTNEQLLDFVECNEDGEDKCNYNYEDYYNEDYLDESLGLVKKSEDLTVENEALEKAETEEDKDEIESEIQSIEDKVDYADDHGLAKDDLLNQLDNLYENADDDFGDTTFWGV